MMGRKLVHFVYGGCRKNISVEILKHELPTYGPV